MVLKVPQTSLLVDEEHVSARKLHSCWYCGFHFRSSYVIALISEPFTFSKDIWLVILPEPNYTFLADESRNLSKLSTTTGPMTGFVS